MKPLKKISLYPQADGTIQMTNAGTEETIGQIFGEEHGISPGRAMENAKKIQVAIAMHENLIEALTECVEPLEEGEACGLPIPLYNKVCALIKQAELNSKF